MLKANFQFYCYCNVTYKFVYYKVTGCWNDQTEKFKYISTISSL